MELDGVTGLMGMVEESLDDILVAGSAIVFRAHTILVSALLAGCLFLWVNASRQRRRATLAPPPTFGSAKWMASLIGGEDEAPPPFGRAMRDQEFLLDAGYTNLNHGSYGAVARRVLQYKHALELRAESRPDVWMRKDYYTVVDQARETVAAAVGAQDVNDLVFVDNASSGVNAVLRSLPWQRGDKVLILSTAYPMVVETLRFLGEEKGVVTVTVHVEFPMRGPEQVLEAVRRALQQEERAGGSGSGFKLAVFSHISSAPAVVLPIADLVDECRQLGNVDVLVDAAHAFGQVDIDVTKLNAAYYVSNFHKWGYSPKTVAFLWVSKERQSAVCPMPGVISATGRRDFVGRFSYVGSRDYTAMASVNASLAFQRWAGQAELRTYVSALAKWAGDYLSTAWGTSLLVPPSMTGFMTNIVLPTRSFQAATAMQERLVAEHGIYIIVKTTAPVPGGSATGAVAAGEGAGGRGRAYSSGQELQEGEEEGGGDTGGDEKALIYCRLSAQVYLEKEDFTALATLVPKMLSSPLSVVRGIPIELL